MILSVCAQGLSFSKCFQLYKDCKEQVVTFYTSMFFSSEFFLSFQSDLDLAADKGSTHTLKTPTSVFLDCGEYAPMSQSLNKVMILLLSFIPLNFDSDCFWKICHEVSENTEMTERLSFHYLFTFLFSFYLLSYIFFIQLYICSYLFCSYLITCSTYSV